MAWRCKEVNIPGNILVSYGCFFVKKKVYDNLPGKPKAYNNIPGKRKAYDETDAFKQADDESIPQNFRNYYNELLIANPTESIATFELSEDPEEEHAKFFLHKYREHANHQNGLPVVISCKIDEKNYLMCATSDYSINLKEKELPSEIPSKTSEFIFYQKIFSTEQSSFCFESSMNQGFYLAFKKEHSIKKLVLKQRPENEIDETIKILLTTDYMPAV